MDKAFASLLENMVSRWTLTLRKLGDSFAQATQFSRFINNAKVTPQAILDEYWQTSTLDFQGRHLLVISDTSTLTFRQFAKREDLGLIDDQSDKMGFNIHPAVVMDAQTKSCYGVAGICVLRKKRLYTKVEKEERASRQSKRNSTPFDKKERYKWFSTCEQAVARCPNAASYTLVGDREADIYALMSMVVERGWHFVYRSKHNRKLVVQEQDKQDTLRDKLSVIPIMYSFYVDLTATNKRSAHRALLHLKCGEIRIKRSQMRSSKCYPEQITLGFVEVKEDSTTVVGKEKPIDWVILTSHPVKNLEDALRILSWYQDRWTIEQVFRTIKLKGLDIENTRYEKFHGLQNLVTIALIAATQIMQLRQAWSGVTQENMENVLLKEEQQVIKRLNTKVEGKTDKLKNPHPEKSLAYASWVIARLGGWSGYHSSSKPGPITFMEGMSHFCTIMRGYHLAIEDP